MSTIADQSSGWNFSRLVEKTLTVKRVTQAMSMYQFVLEMVPCGVRGIFPLYHLRFVARERMLTGILKVLRLPPQCSFWRFLASLHLGAARQLLSVRRHMRARLAGGARWSDGDDSGHRYDRPNGVGVRQPEDRRRRTSEAMPCEGPMTPRVFRSRYESTD